MARPSTSREKTTPELAIVRNGCILFSLGGGKHSIDAFPPLAWDPQKGFIDLNGLRKTAGVVKREIDALRGKAEVSVLLHSEMYEIPAFASILEEQLSRQVRWDVDAIVSSLAIAVGKHTLVDIGLNTTQVVSLDVDLKGYCIKDRDTNTSTALLQRIASELKAFRTLGTSDLDLLRMLFDYSNVDSYNAILANTGTYNISAESFPEMPFNFRTALSQALTNELTNATFFRIVADAFRDYAQSLSQRENFIVQSPLTSYSPMKDYSTKGITFLSEIDLLSVAKDVSVIPRRTSPRMIHFQVSPPMTAESTPCSIWLLCDTDDPSLQLRVDGMQCDVDMVRLSSIFNKTTFKVGKHSMAKVHLGIDLDGCDNVVLTLRTIDGQEAARILN